MLNTSEQERLKVYKGEKTFDRDSPRRDRRGKNPQRIWKGWPQIRGVLHLSQNAAGATLVPRTGSSSERSCAGPGSHSKDTEPAGVRVPTRGAPLRSGLQGRARRDPPRDRSLAPRRPMGTRQGPRKDTSRGACCLPLASSLGAEQTRQADYLLCTEFFKLHLGGTT